MYVYGKVADTKGNPVPGAIIETWETDGHGLYDNQVGVHNTRPSHHSSSGQVPKSRRSRMSRPHHESIRRNLLLSSRSVRHKFRSLL